MQETVNFPYLLENARVIATDSDGFSRAIVNRGEHRYRIEPGKISILRQKDTGYHGFQGFWIEKTVRRFLEDMRAKNTQIADFGKVYDPEALDGDIYADRQC